MQIEFLLIADAVEAVNGKLYMLGGGWDQWRQPVYPSPIQMGIAIGVLVPWDETNQKHQLAVSVIDEDGKPVVPSIGGEVEVGRPAGTRDGITQRALLAINASFAMPRPGRYEVRVEGTAGDIKRVSFEAFIAGPGNLRIG
jgi:hypothetical protein